MPSCSRKINVLKHCLLLPVVLGLALALFGCGGGGGGGGGGGTNSTTVTGTVLMAETGAPPSVATTVAIGNQKATPAADGTFSIAGVPVSATTATVTATGAQTRTLTLALTATATNDLGQIYITTDPAGYTANVSGRVVTQDTHQPVGNATVILAGAKTVTATNGTFTLSNLPVGLGTVAGTFGKVTAPGFTDKPITADVLQFPLVTGSNNIGDIQIASPVSSTTPSPPYTITGVVTVHGAKPTGTVAVTLASNGTTLGSTITDANGNYFFWVVPGTYSITAASGGATSAPVSVTLAQPNAPVTATTINVNP